MTFTPKVPLAWRFYRHLVHTETQFFARTDPMPGTDVLKLCNMPTPADGVTNLRRSTVLIDLSCGEDALIAGMDAKTRKVARQAEREGVRVEHYRRLSATEWRDYLAAYARLRRRKPMAEKPGMGQIHELAKTGRFILTASFSADGAALSWHSYVVCHGVARLYSTVSEIDPARGTQWNNMVGRAHRLHHVRDMLRFREDGVKLYDLGGVYRGSDDVEQINIARFKTSFGGSYAETWDAVLPLTAWGGAALALRGMLNFAFGAESAGTQFDKSAELVH
jgi:hypothetical protein